MNSGSVAWRDVPPMKHPGADLTGIALMGQMLVADRAWRSMTKRQRELVRAAAEPALATEPVTPPLLPDLPPRTAASLRFKHVLDDDGRLTVLALLAAHHGPRLEEQVRESKRRRDAT